MSASVRQPKKEDDKTCHAFVEFSSVEEQKKIAELTDLKWDDDHPLKVGPKLSKEDLKKKITEKKKRMAPQEDYPKGALLRLTNVVDGQDRDTLKAAFLASYPSTKFIDYKSETKVAVVRFTDPADSAKALKDINDKTFKIADQPAEGVLLEGDEEDNYWKDNIIKKTPGGVKRGGKNKKRKYNK